MFTFLLWCILFVLCWPLALLALVIYPFVWLLLLPFRIVGVAVHGVLEIIYLAITLPSACWPRRSGSRQIGSSSDLRKVDSRSIARNVVPWRSGASAPRKACRKTGL